MEDGGLQVSGLRLDRELKTLAQLDANPAPPAFKTPGRENRRKPGFASEALFLSRPPCGAEGAAF